MTFPHTRTLHLPGQWQEYFDYVALIKHDFPDISDRLDVLLCCFWLGSSASLWLLIVIYTKFDVNVIHELESLKQNMMHISVFGDNEIYVKSL